MPGRPKTRAMRVLIDETGVDAILGRIADGQSLTSVAGSLNMSRQSLSKLLRENHGEELKAARLEAGHSLVEEALRIADASTPISAQVDKNRVDIRRWLAGKLNRDYSDQQPNSITLSIGELHISALKKISLQDRALLVEASPDDPKIQ